MALSLDSMFQPLNSFFLKLFQTGPDSPVVFRFDRFNSIISDGDFIDPLHPDQGYSPFRAMEKLSDMVNHIPSDTGDGMSIAFRLDSIDQTYYYRLLSPALPYVAAGAPDGQGPIDAFGTLKAAALKTWENVKLESSTGMMFQYKPALAQPENWYDKNRAEIWTHQSFDFDASTPPVVPQRPETRLWRLRLDDQRLSRLLQTKLVAAAAPRNLQMVPGERIATMGRIGGLQTQGAALAPLAFSAAVAQPQIKSLADVMLVRKVIDPAQLAASMAATPAAIPAPGLSLHATLRNNLTKIRLNDRIQLAREIGEAAPTAPAATDNVKVSFDYCLVKVRRPWYMNAFIDDRSWYVPGLAKGEVTAGAATNGFNMMPVALVAIKDLEIVANWAAADVNAAAEAEDFGPFKVNAGISRNRLMHEGMQAIGWLVERMPELPPNAMPA